MPDATATIQSVGNYDILSKIAEGGMGAVYRGRSRATGEIVAIKIIPSDTARNPVLLRRFEQEFRAASLINHPNVVKAIDYGAGATPFLVMEFVDGESLGARLERSGAIPEAEAVRLIGQVCEGLHRAHKQGLIHRDVKPDNILVTREGVAKLTDLGLVKEVEADTNLTRTGRGLGTPHFMAPEQFRNAKNADVRCDIYSLGATLYAMLTGDTPFNKCSPLDCWVRKTKNDLAEPRKLKPALSERTNWAVIRAMGADPATRPASCREFMEDLIGAGWRAGSGLFTSSGGPGGSGAPDSIVLGAEDLWYMVYRDENGQPRTVKGTTDSIRKNLMAGALGDQTLIVVSRTKNGQFQPLRSMPEFRDLVTPASGAYTSPTAGGGSGTGLPRSDPAGRSGPLVGARRPPTPSAPVSASTPRGTGYPPARPSSPIPYDASRPASEAVLPRVDMGGGADAGGDWTPLLVGLAAAFAGIVGALLFLQ